MPQSLRDDGMKTGNSSYPNYGNYGNTPQPAPNISLSQFYTQGPRVITQSDTHLAFSPNPTSEYPKYGQERVREWGKEGLEDVLADMRLVFFSPLFPMA